MIAHCHQGSVGRSIASCTKVAIDARRGDLCNVKGDEAD